MTNVLVPLAEGVEEMEAVIIIDVFRRAGWRVDVVGLKKGVVEASRGVKLVPDRMWEQVDPAAYEVIVLPGGNLGTMNLMEDERVLDALRVQHRAGKLIAAVCAAPLVLQKAGIIDQKRVTCHPLAAAQLTSANRVDARVVIDDNIVTSQGPGTTFAFALAIVELRDGRAKAVELARGMVLGQEEGF
jgi:4-methyl-5(b-hydroxyethyl)-thiazole monophosphate biosynthesis